MKEVTHLMCLTFDNKYTMLVEFDAPEDFTESALLTAACQKARNNCSLIKNLSVTNKQYCGTVTETIFIH